MDFVQRNLINERNNLQIELAKAKILIAQLNESVVEGLKDVVRKAHADKANLSVAGAQVAASATKALRKMGEISHNNGDHHFGDDLKPFELSESVEQQIRAVKKAEKVVFKNANMHDSNLASATSVMGMPVSVNTGVVANATHPSVADSQGVFKPDGMLVNISTAKNLKGLFTDPNSRTTLRHELAHVTQFAVQHKRGRINPSLPNMKLKEPRIIPSNVHDLSGVNYSNQDLEINARAISSAVDANRQHKKEIRKHLAAGLSLQDAKHAARTSMLNKHMSTERTDNRNIIDDLVNQDTEFVPNKTRPSERLPKTIKKLIYGSKALTRKVRSARGEKIIDGLNPIGSYQTNSILPAGPISNKDRSQRVSKAIMYGAKAEKKVRKAISRGLQMAEKGFEG